MHLNSGEFANPVPVSVHSCIPGVTQLLKYYFAFFQSCTELQFSQFDKDILNCVFKNKEKIKILHEHFL